MPPGGRAKSASCKGGPNDHYLHWLRLGSTTRCRRPTSRRAEGRARRSGGIHILPGMWASASLHGPRSQRVRPRGRPIVPIAFLCPCDRVQRRRLIASLRDGGPQYVLSGAELLTPFPNLMSRLHQSIGVRSCSYRQPGKISMCERAKECSTGCAEFRQCLWVTSTEKERRALRVLCAPSIRRRRVRLRAIIGRSVAGSLMHPSSDASSRLAPGLSRARRRITIGHQLT